MALSFTRTITVLEWLVEPLGYGFMLRGLGAALLAALACAVLSSFVVWRGWAFIGDALAHAIFPGIVVAYILGLSLIIGGPCGGLWRGHLHRYY